MRIGIIGAGNVGGRLASRWHELGHEVVVGRRDASVPSPHLAAAVPAASPAEAIVDAEVVVLAVPGASVVDAASFLPLDGRIVVDATNPVGLTLPAGERTLFGAVVTALEEASPSARPVKAFNTLGAEAISAAADGGPRPFLPVAADDVAAAATVVGLAAELGFDAVHLGPAERAAELEALARIWMSLAFGPPAFGRGVRLTLDRG